MSDELHSLLKSIPKMRILIIGDFRFPFGTAAASRIRLLSKGLRENGAEVRVITAASIIDRPEDCTPRHWKEYYGIRYETTAGYILERKQRIRRVKNALLGALRSWQHVRTLTKARELDAVILYSWSFFHMQPIISMCKRVRVPVITSSTERIETFFFRWGRVDPLYFNARLGESISQLCSNGIIVISSHLACYFRNKGARVLLVPTLIEDNPEWREIFKAKRERHLPFNITYLGNLHPRNGPYEMVEAIRQAAMRGYSVKLTIVGADDKKGIGLRIRNMCDEDARFRGCVEFVGRVPDNEVPIRLWQSDCLILARPYDRSADAAFPTRLAEYLVSGRPVIVTAVGDIPRYFRDGTDAMIVEPGNPRAIADRIEVLMKMPDWGDTIGKSGRRRALEFFDYRVHAARILDFILKIDKGHR